MQLKLSGFTAVVCDGQSTAVQLPEKNGGVAVALILPLNPASHVQPSATSVPVECDGQLTAVQLPEKNGAVAVALTLPLNPASQVHPDGTLAPVEPSGHGASGQQLPPWVPHWRHPPRLRPSTARQPGRRCLHVFSVRSALHPCGLLDKLNWGADADQRGGSLPLAT